MATELVWIKSNKKSAKSAKYILVPRVTIPNITSLDIAPFDFNLYNPHDTHTIDNLSYLKFINEPSILNILHKRYDRDKIYTLNSKVIISINPFKRIESLYDLNRYCYNENVPHIYQMAELSYKNLLKTNTNQAILVSGESGAGKTENTKYILKYLSNKYAPDNISAQQIIDCNYIIEMLGNSMTRRNDNSSRFGKFIKIYFKDEKIIGAHIENYLLEKSRVTHYNILEKSYHIFYALQHPIMRKYNFHRSYLHEKSNRKVISEFNNIERFIIYLYKFKFSDIEIDKLFYTIKLVLQLMDIKDYDNIEEEIDSISNTLNQLDLSKEDFILNMTKKVFNTREGPIYKVLDKGQIKVRIKSFCEDIYSNLFNSIISKINVQLNKHSELLENDTKDLHYIGILDIFGFEIFEENGFEQLCINYTNEVLQNIYNDNILEYEQREYIKDGIDWEFIEYQSNENIIKFFNKELLPVINEQSILETGTDNILYGKLVKLQNAILSVDDKTKYKNRFTINHYAGNVHYDVVDYILKNKIKGVNRKVKTNIHIFKKKLDELKKELKKNQCWFIRCIKPNNTNKPHDWDDHKIYEQLVYSGIIEGIRLVLQGFPIKIPLCELSDEFRFLNYYNIDVVSYIADSNVYDNKFRVGNTKLFLKRFIYTNLLEKEAGCKSQLITYLQACFRRTQQYKQYGEIKMNIIRLQSVIRKCIIKNRLLKIKHNRSATVVSTIFRGYIQKQQYLHIKNTIIKIQIQYRIVRLYRERKNMFKIHYKKLRVVKFIKTYAKKRISKLIRSYTIIYCLYRRNLLGKKINERSSVNYLKNINDEIRDQLALQKKIQVEKEHKLLDEIERLKQKSLDSNSMEIILNQEISRLQNIINSISPTPSDELGNDKIGNYDNYIHAINFDNSTNDVDIDELVDSNDTVINDKVINDMGFKMEQLYIEMNRKEDRIKELIKQNQENERRCSIM